jgi:UDPglucose 6-dehydrogenase
MVERIARTLGELQGKRVGVLGLTFKPNTDDIRESPAVKIIAALLEKGASVAAFDPAGMEAAGRVLGEVHYKEDLYAVAEGADALVIATEWNEFRSLDWERIKGLLRAPVVFDLRNIYHPDRMKASGFDYHCVGRGYE